MLHVPAGWFLQAVSFCLFSYHTFFTPQLVNRGMFHVTKCIGHEVSPVLRSTHPFCEGEVIVQGDEGPVRGVAQVVDYHGVTVGHQEKGGRSRGTARGRE